MLKIINYFLQSLIIYLFFLVGRILGLKISRNIFSFLFSFIGPIFKSKRIIENNLDIFSSKVSNLDRKKIVSEMWKNYGMTFIEYIFLSYFRNTNFNVILKNEENLLNIVQEKKPVIFISGHFANFELMSMEITKRNIPLATIYRPLNNIFLNPFMEHLRKKNVCKNQIKKGINGVRESIEYIKRKNCIALMIDQRVSEGEKTNFFDNPCLTTTLPAQLALKYKLKIVPLLIKREKNNCFEISCEAPIDSKNFKDKIHLTRFLNTKLEIMIKKNPEQWIWTHNRWKL